jgi:hypothetical protein
MAALLVYRPRQAIRAPRHIVLVIHARERVSCAARTRPVRFR